MPVTISKNNSLHSERPVHQTHRTLQHKLRIGMQPWSHTTHQMRLNPAPKTQDAHRAPPKTQDAHRAPPETQDAHCAPPETQDAHCAPRKTQDAPEATPNTPCATRHSTISSWDNRRVLPLPFSDIGHLGRNRFHTVKLLNLLLVDFYCSNIQATSEINTQS